MTKGDHGDVDGWQTRVAGPGRTMSGLAFALLSAASFGLSGALARRRLDTGWTPGAVTLARIAIAAAVVAPFGAVAMRGRWHPLRRDRRLVAVYGLVAVAAEFSYFSAVAHIPVAPALLIEFTAPAAALAGSGCGTVSAPVG